VRPVTLKVKGFTSFRDEQEIDFSELDLFALWGPTGSGKSSVLDAMTYALFGYVERVGREASRLVSQGQPRMAVTLDFVVGADTYRVTRSTPASGQTKARFERLVGDEFESRDEGADQVKGVNDLVKKVVGLDYEAFTRSVILPQGKFAEFLTGEAKNRRRILTELLGLELFKRMAQRANEIAKEARISAEVKGGLLERDYAGIDAEAVAAAAREAKDAAALASRLGKAEAKIDQLCRRWDEDGRRVDALVDCTTEMTELAETVAEHHATLLDAAASTGPLAAEVAAAEADVKAAEAAVVAADDALAKASKEWGDLEHLASLRQVALNLTKTEADLAAAEQSLDDESKKATAAGDEVASMTDLLAKARAEAAIAAKELAEREADHDRAHDAENVGALVMGLGPGDPCPVCEKPLDALPDVSLEGLKAAKRSLEAARAARDSMERAVASAEKDLALAESALATARQAMTRCTTEAAARRKEVDAQRAQLASVGADVAGDRVATILAERIDGLKQLTQAATAATRGHGDATTRLAERSRALETARARVGETRAALASLALGPALKRVAATAPKVSLPQPWPKDAPVDAGELAALAGSLRARLEALASKLDVERAKADEARTKLLGQAVAALPEGFDVEVDDLHALKGAVRGVARRASEDAALAGKHASDLEQKLVASKSLQEEITAHKLEQETYKALGVELKDDRIVEFLQEEALQVLAVAATSHLHDLSSGRYKLSFQEGDFSVIDAWNGDEQRSVTTLSGGETFLASLSLALALSEQIQLLAVSERNKLESLFLDEGFGTLDAETLEIVVAAIEQLGGGDRLVGVITHVPDLAERLPVRLDVTKSPRGSVVTRRVGELTGRGL
jgi:DNA repair protein SbcC/Rad50